MKFRDEAADSYLGETGPAGSADPEIRQRAHSAHLAEIDAYVRAWQQGEITLTQKRRAISDENRSYYGPNCRRALLWP